MLLGLDTPDIEGAAASGQAAQGVDAQALLVFLGDLAAGQAGQTVDAQALLQFVASATSGQGGQTVDAAAVLQFIAAASSAQGSQGVDSAALLQFIAAAVAAQGSQAIDAAALLQFIADATAGQATQSAEGTGFNGQIVSGPAESAQGAQTADAEGDVGEPPKIYDGGHVLRTLNVPITVRRARAMLTPIEAISAAGASGQGAQSATGRGEVENIPAIEAAGATAQASAEVIAIGSVDNRRPRNIRKSKIAAALLLAA